MCLDSWNKIFFRALSVKTFYCNQQYADNEDIFYIPINNSNDLKVLIDRTANIIGNNFCCITIKRTKETPLCNLFSMGTNLAQNNYENHVRFFIQDHLKKIIKSLKVGESLIVYMDEFGTWRQTIIRNKDNFKIINISNMI